MEIERAKELKDSPLVKEVIEFFALKAQELMSLENFKNTPKEHYQLEVEASFLAYEKIAQMLEPFSDMSNPQKFNSKEYTA